MKKYDIFLSYCGDGGFETAVHIYNILTHDGYTVSFDKDNSHSGPFNDNMRKRVGECTDFIVILDEHVFDRYKDPEFDFDNDSLRIELAHALEKKKNIISIKLDGFKDFPNNLPEDIKDIRKYHFLKFDNEFPCDFYKKLKSNLKSSQRLSLLLLNYLQKKSFSELINWIFIYIVLFCLLFIIVDGYENNKSYENDDIVKLTSAEFMYQKGYNYHKGQGVSQDYKQALFWYKKAAEKGNTKAMNSIGFCYDRGLGVSQNYKQALFWYKKAAEKGDIYAMYNLGYYYYQGLGISQDYNQALYWYKKSAEGGCDVAMNNLGGFYLKGEGVSQDYKQALFWFKKAAEKGNSTAIINLALFYRYGKGVEINELIADKLIKASDIAKNGDTDRAIEMVKEALKITSR